MLFASLAPGLSHAARAKAASFAGLVAVCTSVGVIFIDPAAGEVREPPLKEYGAEHFERCPCCFVQAPPVSPAGETALLLSVLKTEMPRLFSLSPRPLFAWASAPPRAPPAAS